MKLAIAELGGADIRCEMERKGEIEVKRRSGYSGGVNKGPCRAFLEELQQHLFLKAIQDLDSASVTILIRLSDSIRM